MQVRVICNDGSWGSAEDCELNALVRASKVTAFYCPISNEWIDVVREFCEDCQIWHLAPPEDSHACVFHRQLKCENT